jgi:type IV secretion system protein VirB9
MIAWLFLALVQLPLQPGFTDPRIQVVAYSPGEVLTLRVALGYATVLELSSDERIENVVVGNSAGWQVTPNRRGDRLVVKPLATAATTNMVVITDARRYVLLLEPGSGDLTPFVVRFTYPAADPITLSKEPQQLATYRLRGDKVIMPIAMTDDGQRTRITWQPGTDLPAIFAVDSRGKEGLVNGRMVGTDYIVETVARRFVFRLDRKRATASRRPVTKTQ